MKVFLAFLVVLAILVGVGIKFLVSPVVTAYGICEEAKNQKFANLMTPADGEDMSAYCTSSREAIDDMADCMDRAAQTSAFAPYIISYTENASDAYGSAATSHAELCPTYKLGME